MIPSFHAYSVCSWRLMICSEKKEKKNTFNIFHRNHFRNPFEWNNGKLFYCVLTISPPCMSIAYILLGFIFWTQINLCQLVWWQSNSKNIHDRNSEHSEFCSFINRFRLYCGFSGLKNELKWRNEDPRLDGYWYKHVHAVLSEINTNVITSTEIH